MVGLFQDISLWYERTFSLGEFQRLRTYYEGFDTKTQLFTDISIPQSVIVGGIATNPIQNVDIPSKYQVWSKEGYGVSGLTVLSSSYQKMLTHSTWRQSPDVVWLAGYPGVFIKTPSSWSEPGGTSLSAPMWAALWSLGDAAHKKVFSTALPTDANQTLYLLANQKTSPYVINTEENKKWQEKWGLGYPDPEKLVNDLAQIHNDQVKLQNSFSISEIPFLITTAIAVLVFVWLLIEVLIRRMLLRKNETHNKVYYWGMYALLIPYFACAVTGLVVNKVPHPNFKLIRIAFFAVGIITTWYCYRSATRQIQKINVKKSGISF